MPGKLIPQTRKTKTRRTSLQRDANRRGLLNLNSAIETELARLNNVRRLFNMDQQNPRIVEKERAAYQEAMALVRELEEDAQRDEAERLRLVGIYRAAVVAAATSAREAAEARRLASLVLQGQGVPVPAAAQVPAAPLPLNLSGGPGVHYPGNLPLNNSELSPFVTRHGGKLTRRKVKNTKKSRKHLRR
jgi:hypothetical protein